MLYTNVCCYAGINLEIVNCKVTWEGTYRFSYEVEFGGGGICDSPGSAVVACQEPGSVYVDNQVFTMYFGKCPMVTTSVNQGLYCMLLLSDPSYTPVPSHLKRTTTVLLQKLCINSYSVISQ